MARFRRDTVKFRPNRIPHSATEARSFATLFASPYLSGSMPSPVTAEMGNSSSLFFLQNCASRSNLFCGFDFFLAATLLVLVLAERDFLTVFFLPRAFGKSAS